MDENFDPSAPVNYNLITEQDAIELLKEINRFPVVIKDTADKYEPSIVEDLPLMLSGI
ncbi:MAG: hypothetical protein ACLTDF_06820 [Coprococcus sp.]